MTAVLGILMTLYSRELFSRHRGCIRKQVSGKLRATCRSANITPKLGRDLPEFWNSLPRFCIRATDKTVLCSCITEHINVTLCASPAIFKY